jgi:predicted enzyme related to lactoylglutathione lyase
MERVIGIGGVFFKSTDADKLRQWYQSNLGIDVDPSYGGAMFDDTAWSIFPSTTHYFDPSTKPYMINYRVRDLDAMLDQLRRAGATIDPKIDDTDYGRFGWAMDPEGNRIELWEPKR